MQNCEPRGKKYKGAALRRQQYLRPPESDTVADGVTGTTMKRCIHRHLIHPNQRPLRSPKPKRHHFLPPKPDTAAHSVIETAMRHLTHPD
jgi:hypothetical protein